MNVSPHERWMRRALDLARLALPGGDVPVGALVVRGEEAIAEAFEQVRAKGDPAAHAELAAVRAACAALGARDLSACRVYTTAEPCFMCAYPLRITRIAKVVIGAPVANVGALNSKYPILVDAHMAGWPPPPWIVRDVLLHDCLALRAAWQESGE